MSMCVSVLQKSNCYKYICNVAINNVDFDVNQQ